MEISDQIPWRNIGWTISNLLECRLFHLPSLSSLLLVLVLAQWSPDWLYWPVCSFSMLQSYFQVREFLERFSTRLVNFLDWYSFPEYSAEDSTMLKSEFQLKCSPPKILCMTFFSKFPSLVLWFWNLFGRIFNSEATCLSVYSHVCLWVIVVECFDD